MLNCVLEEMADSNDLDDLVLRKVDEDVFKQLRSLKDCSAGWRRRIDCRVVVSVAGLLKSACRGLLESLL